MNGIIDPAKCKIKVKSSGITIEMKKGNTKYWDDIKEKKGLLSSKKKEEEEKDKDPSASLMEMMKELYETGDEQMKKTIAESWQKAQQDKSKGKV